MWLTIALTTVVCILPVVAFRFLKLSLKPDLSDTVSARLSAWGWDPVSESPRARVPALRAAWWSREIPPPPLCPGRSGPPPRGVRPRRGPSPPPQVRYSQLVRKKRAQHRCTRRPGRTSSRRSGYAFAHQEGFGELIMSGKNMRLSSLGLAGFATRSGSGWIESLRRKRSDSPGSPPDKPLKG